MAEYNIPVDTPVPQTEEGNNIPVVSQDVPLPDNIARDRANKADFGLQGKVDKTYGDYYSSFAQGQERYIRDYIANKLQEQINQQRNQAYISLFNSKQGSVTKEDVDSLVDYVNDPKSVIEDHYAQKYMNQLNWPTNNTDNTNWLNQIHAEEPGASNVWDRQINLGTEYLAKHLFLLKGEQDASLNAENQSWVGWTIDQLKNLSGLYPIIEGKTPGTSWLNLPGSQREDFMNKLWSLPYDQMKTEYNQFMSYYMAHNPSAAREFAHEMTGMSSSDKLLQNVLPIVQPGVEISALAGVAKAFATRNAINTAITQQIQSAAAQTGMSPQLQAALTAGAINQSATQRAWGAIVNSVRRSDPIREAEEKLPNIFRIGREQLLENTGGDIAGTNLLVEEYDRIIRDFPQLALRLTGGERLPALAEKDQAAIQAAQDQVLARTRDLSDRILNISEPYRLSPTGSWNADIILGRSPLETFGTSGEAGRVVAQHGLDGFEIKQTGTGFVAIKSYPIQENTLGMRSHMAKLSSDRTPEGGVISSLLARFRTPNETQSDWAIRNREAATFTSSVLEQYAYEQAEAIRKLQPLVTGRQKWDDWERVLNASRKVYDPDTNRIGYTYKNIGELEYAYRKMLGRSPDAQEVAAYFSFKRIQEFDHALRTISIMKHKQRLGVSDNVVTWRNPKLPGDIVDSPRFDGTVMDHLPRGKDTIAIIDENGTVDIKRLNALGNHPSSGPGTKAFPKHIYYSDQVQKGEMKVVALHAPEQTPLSGYGGLTSDHIVRYVLVPFKMLSDKVLDWNTQLPWRGGGHFVYKHHFMGSQLDIRPETIGTKTIHKLVGTNTGWTFENAIDGERIIGFANQARVLLQKVTPANIAAARDIVENKLNMNWAEFLGWFKPSPVRNALGQWRSGGKPRFNLTEPFKLHTVNENLANKVPESELKARYKNYEDTRRLSPNQQFMTAFSQERDANNLFTFRNEGTTDAPMYKYEPSPLLDAIPTMNRATNKIANTLAMDDMKAHAVETWLQESKNYLSVKESLLNSSPLYWFHHADFKTDLKNSPLQARKISELEVAREQIKSFIGQVSETDAVIGYWTQKLADKMYESSISGISRLARKIDPVNLAHTLSDPTRFIRTMTFHKSMGLMAIPQILVQGQTYVNILGIAGPTKALQGTVSAMLHQWSRINSNPNILKSLGRWAEKVGFRPGEWEEAREALLSTGFHNVGTEYALRDNPMSNKVVQTRWGQFLEFGALPFTEGEKNVRFGSWYTAYKEFRDNNPTGSLSNANKLEILNRAALLNGNMNRASNAMYQRGFAALPSQFLTYTIRQAELFWGKRLTKMEKARLLVTNAMMYGLPVGIGITGLPSDFFKNAAIERGYNPSDNYISSLIGNGIPETILALIDHDRHWNVGERFGNSGFNDLLYGDKTMWENIGGAAYSSMKSIFEGLDPFRQAIMSGYRQDGEHFTIKYDHFAQLFREITSFNTAERAIIAAKTGNWISKNGSRLYSDISIPESVMSFITGLQPQEAADIRHITDIQKAEKNVEQWAERRFVQEVGRALEAYNNNDPTNGNAYMANAMMYLNTYTPEDRKEAVMARGFDRYQDVAARVSQTFGTKDVPPGLEEARRNQYIRGLK